MYKSLLLGAVVAPVLASGLTIMGMTVGHADTYVQTSDDCSGGCGINSGNTVTVTQDGTNTVDISVQLASGWTLISSGASGNSQVAFGLSSTLTSVDFKTGTTAWSTTGWTPTPSSGSVSATSPQTVSGQSIDSLARARFQTVIAWNGMVETVLPMATAARLTF